MLKKSILYIVIVFISFPFSLKSEDSMQLNIAWRQEIFPKEIKEAFFSVDGNFIYTAIGNTIHKVSSSTGEFLSAFQTDNPETNIGHMCLSKEGNFIITDDGTRTIKIWDTKSETVIKQIDYYKSSAPIWGVTSFNIFNDENIIIFSFYEYYDDNNYNNHLVLYDIELEQVIKRIPTDCFYTKIIISNDGTKFVTGGNYRDINNKNYNQTLLWSVESLTVIDTIESLEAGIEEYYTIKFSPDDKFVGTLNKNDYRTRIYNLETKTIVFISNEMKYCGNFEFLPDNLHFLSSYSDIEANYELILSDFSNEIQEFNILAGTMDTYNADGTWKIFCSSFTSPMYMLTNKTESVNEEIFGIKIYQVKSDIIIEDTYGTIKPLDVIIYDLQGKIVYQNRFEYSERIVINTELLSGFYICSVINGSYSYSKKIEIIK